MWIWIRLKVTTVEAARLALKILSMGLHREAQVEPDKARRSDLRAEGDHYEARSEEIRRAETRTLLDDKEPKK